ncbi:NAD-dependent epimerase/dehydratase family protein [Dactylosporangium sucinum]|uniref:UDP-glucose 4-epimerase n=1 Tax=Dactylosporangium sucinum TaxID=1424081 RepID=A0A917U9H7_9ACTN|nr:NAD(P)-dependent oxidoreductase [Dactylosporangium sucinum]GGM68612.1 UDP-glucose 4-epimerase [Dactylosporangium sucinum]
MRILVTGAGGNIGRAVVSLLAASGDSVVGLSLEPAADLPVDRLVVGSAGDPAVVADALGDGVDAVVHLAARPSPNHGTPLEVFGGNTQATFVVLDEAARRGVRRLVFAGSYAMFGTAFSPHGAHPPYYPLDERAPLQVADPYALSKQVDEATGAMVALRYGASVVSLRFPYTVGWEQLHRMADAVRANPALVAHDSWSYLHVDDAAEAVRLALTVPLSGFHAVLLAAPETLAPWPTEDLIREHHPDTPIRAPIPGRSTPIDTSAAAALLGFRPARHLPL